MTQREKILLHLSDKKNVSVEFGLADDIKKENGRIIALYDRVVNDFKDSAAELDRISAMYEKNSKEADIAMKKAKELGADDIYKSLSESKSLADKYSKEAAARSKKLYSL